MKRGVKYWEIGVKSGNVPVNVPLTKSFGIFGTTGAGKSTAIALLAEHVMESRSAGYGIQLWMNDPPDYLGVIEGCFTNYGTDTDHALHMWASATAEFERRMTARSELIRAGKMIEVLGPEHGFDYIVVLQDECSSLMRTLLTKNKTRGDRLRNDMIFAAKNFRKAGMFIGIGDQDPKDTNVPVDVKRYLETKVVLRVDDDQVVRNCVGSSMARSMPAHQIARDVPGRGYIVSRLDPTPTLLQVHYLDPARMSRISERARAITGQGSGQPSGQRSGQPPKSASNALHSGPGPACPESAPDPAVPEVVAEATARDDQAVPGIYWHLKYGAPPMRVSEFNRLIYGEKDNEKHIRRSIDKLRDAGLIEQTDAGTWRLKEAS